MSLSMPDWVALRAFRGRCVRCGHTVKHHKRSGRCRGNCECDLAWVKARRKLSKAKH
jgi:hypothetical protein